MLDRKQNWFIPSALPQTNSGYPLAGQNSKHHCAGEGQFLNDSLYHIFHIWKLYWVVPPCPWLFWYFSSPLVACFMYSLHAWFPLLQDATMWSDLWLPTFCINGCRLHIALANIFQTKEWAASFTCSLFKIAIEEVHWNPSFTHHAHVTQQAKSLLGFTYGHVIFDHRISRHYQS